MGVYNGERKASHVKPIQIGREYFNVLVKRNNKLNAKYFYETRAIGHAGQKIIGPTGERARENSRTIYNL